MELSWRWTQHWGTTPHAPSPVLVLIIDILVVQSHIMWSWSTANYHNWTSCFLFSSLLACFTVWSCYLLSIVVLLALFLVILFFSPSCLILFIVIQPSGRNLVLIKSYHIITSPTLEEVRSSNSHVQETHYLKRATYPLHS